MKTATPTTTTTAQPIAMTMRVQPLVAGKPATPAPCIQGCASKHVTADPPLVNLFEQELQNMLDAETQLESALPILAICATSSHMVDMYVAILRATSNHIARLHNTFALANFSPHPKQSPVVQGFIKELALTIELTPVNSILRDMELLFTTQKIAQHTITAYGSLRNIARLHGYKQAMALLQQTLYEKMAIEGKLIEMITDLQSATATPINGTTTA